MSDRSVKQECLTRALHNSVKQGCPTRVSPQCVPQAGSLKNVTNKYCLCSSTYASALGSWASSCFVLWCKHLENLACSLPWWWSKRRAPNMSLDEHLSFNKFDIKNKKQITNNLLINNCWCIISQTHIDHKVQQVLFTFIFQKNNYYIYYIKHRVIRTTQFIYQIAIVDHCSTGWLMIINHFSFINC